MSDNTIHVKPHPSTITYTQSTSDVYRSPSLNIAAGGWMIIGRPTLWQLLKHWWRQP